MRQGVSHPAAGANNRKGTGPRGAKDDRDATRRARSQKSNASRTPDQTEARRRRRSQSRRRGSIPVQNSDATPNPDARPKCPRSIATDLSRQRTNVVSSARSAARSPNLSPNSEPTRRSGGPRRSCEAQNARAPENSTPYGARSSRASITAGMKTPSEPRGRRGGDLSVPACDVNPTRAQPRRPPPSSRRRQRPAHRVQSSPRAFQRLRMRHGRQRARRTGMIQPVRVRGSVAGRCQSRSGGPFRCRRRPARTDSGEGASDLDGRAAEAARPDRRTRDERPRRVSERRIDRLVGEISPANNGHPLEGISAAGSNSSNLVDDVTEVFREGGGSANALEQGRRREAIRIGIAERVSTLGAARGFMRSAISTILFLPPTEGRKEAHRHLVPSVMRGLKPNPFGRQRLRSTNFPFG